MSTATIPATACPDHGPDCFMGCICSRCGINRRELYAIAHGHASMTEAQRRCWRGAC